MKTVIVTGGRNYKNAAKVEDVLMFLEPELIVQGGASGADMLAKYWAQERKLSYVTYEANWDALGKSAGPERNKRMLTTHPDAIVLAFPGGKGTANCVSQAIALGMTVLEVKN